MKTAAAIVTNRGGRTCHAAIIARELGVPAVVGTGDATTTHPERQAGHGLLRRGGHRPGLRGRGALPRRAHRDLGTWRVPRRTIMINLGNPDLAFKTSFLPNDGVGSGADGVHHQRVHQGPPARAAASREGHGPVQPRETIAKLIRGYPDGEAFFVERLSEGIGTIAAAFWPKPVVVRMSDFKTNEYASLLGGADFEPARGQPDARFPWRLALRPPRLRGGIRARVPGDEAGPRGDGPHERRPDAAVRPSRRGGRAGPRADGRDRSRTRARTASRSTRCARSRTTSS